ncbi:MAG: chromosomal replication initiator protein DnaA [Deltaproteobacteria bacterium]|nr:chromosomal replication initiator protein DnaA [Deltaproteobacteria bacterium]
MSRLKKKEIWEQIIASLESTLQKEEFQTWFSRASLKKLDETVAIIDVPHKFIATWLNENYLIEIKKTIKKLTKSAPTIHFTFEIPPLLQTLYRTKPQFPFHPSTNHGLNRDFTFDRLATADSNSFACSSAHALAGNGAEKYSLLYIFSKPGLGKTHLLHAIGNHRLKKDPICKVRYLSSNTFTSEFTYAVNTERLDLFREQYCNLDLLLFDDIHLLDHSEKIQEEFLSIFNSLYSEKKQIVITGNSLPNVMKNLKPELKSRLGWGLLTEIHTPEQQVKMNIVRTKVSEISLDIPDDVLFFLANANSNIKTLKKNLLKLETYSSMSDGKITMSVVKALIKDMESAGISLEEIINTTAGYFNISVANLLSHKKNHLYAYPRQLAMYLARLHTGLSYKDIGRSFKKKDHSTVIYAIKRIEGLKTKDSNIGDDLRIIESLLG